MDELISELKSLINANDKAGLLSAISNDEQTNPCRTSECGLSIRHKAIEIAIKNNNTEIMAALLNAEFANTLFPPNDEHGYNNLHFALDHAIDQNKIDCIKHILDSGEGDNFGNTIWPKRDTYSNMRHFTVEHLVKVDHADALMSLLDENGFGNEEWPESFGLKTNGIKTVRGYALIRAAELSSIQCLEKLLTVDDFADTVSELEQNDDNAITPRVQALEMVCATTDCCCSSHRYECILTIIDTNKNHEQYIHQYSYSFALDYHAMFHCLKFKRYETLCKILLRQSDECMISCVSETLEKRDDDMRSILSYCTTSKRIEYLNLFKKLKLIKVDHHPHTFLKALETNDLDTITFWVDIFSHGRLSPKSVLLILESISKNNAMSQFLQYTTQNRNGIVLCVALIETLFSSDSRATRKIIESHKVTVIKLLQTIKTSQERLPFQNTNDDAIFRIIEHVIGMRPAEATKKWDNEVLLPLLRCIQPERIQAKRLELEILINKIGQTDNTGKFFHDLKKRSAALLETSDEIEIMNKLERDTNGLLTELINQLEQSPQNQNLTQLSIFVINKLCVEKKSLQNINKIETLFGLVLNVYPSHDLAILKSNNNISQSMKKRIIDVEQGRLESLITKLKEHNKTQKHNPITLLDQRDYQTLYLHKSNFQHRIGHLIINQHKDKLIKKIKFKQCQNTVIFKLKRNDRLSFFAPQQADIHPRFLFSGTPIRKASPNQIYAISYKEMSLYDLSNEIKKAAKMMLSKAEFNELENVIECWLTDLESPLLKDRVSKSIASSINGNIGGECKMGC